MKRLFLVGMGLWGLFSFSGSTVARAAEALTLEKVLETTRKNSPDLQVLRSRVDAANARVTASPQIPAPMVGISYMGMDGPFRSNGMNEKPSYEVSQTIPFPTKIISRVSAAKADLKVTSQSQMAEQKAIEATAKMSFWNYYKAFQEKEILQNEIELLKDHLKRSRRGPISDSLKSAHLLEIEGEIVEKENDLLDANLGVERAKNSLKVVMGDSSIDIPAPQAPELSQKTISFPQQIKTTKTLVAQSALEKAQADKSTAKWDYLPDITVKYRWNSEFGPVPKNQELMVGIDLPFLFFWQKNASVSESHAKSIEAEANLRKEQLNSEASLKNLTAEIETMRAQYLKLKNEALPKITQRLHIVHQSSSFDMETLSEHRMAFEKDLEIQRKILSLRVGLEERLAELEALVPGDEKHEQAN